MKALKFFNYSGTKLKYVNTINSHLNTHKKVYIEPFVGSGAVLFNLTNEFDTYIVNDADRNIIAIYKSFLNMELNDYYKSVEFVLAKFGDISKNKESFYSFRNWFNENEWMTNSINEGIYLHILASSVINSMLRFGSNGMNQSFGKRFNLIDVKNIEKIKTVLSKTEIHNVDYKEMLNYDGFFFFDPPYYSQDSSYKGFNGSDLKSFIDNIQHKEFLYTDILNEYNDVLPNKIFLKEMSSTAPNSKKKKNNNMEHLFSNKEIKEYPHSTLFDWDN